MARRGDALNETVVWQGRSFKRAIARDVFHLRAIAAFLAALEAYQAWTKAIPPAKALHDSVSLAAIIVAVLVNLVRLAILTARTTRYTITTQRVILAYSIAIPETLAIPHGRIRRSSCRRVVTRSATSR